MDANLHHGVALSMSLDAVKLSQVAAQALLSTPVLAVLPAGVLVFVGLFAVARATEPNQLRPAAAAAAAAAAAITALLCVIAWSPEYRLLCREALSKHQVGCNSSLE
jgi:uncharacterized membrane protein